MHLLRSRMIALLLGGPGCFLISIAGVAQAQDAKPSLEEAFRKWDMGFSSDKKEDRVATLRTMIPTKDELAYLFPKHVDKLWPKFEEGHKYLEEMVDVLAKEISGGGIITKVKAIDVRADKNKASGLYKDLLAIIPNDVQVFELVVHRTKSSSGGGTYLCAKDRWFWIKDADTFPRILDMLK